MSRSWTPQELYHMDKYLQREQGKSLRESQVLFIKPNGERVPLEDKQTLNVRNQYKELGFLFDILPTTYKILEKHPKYRKKVLDRIETHLKEIEELKSGNDKDVVWLWYTGKLDKNFYYNSYNNELFMEYIINEVNKLVNGGKQK